MAPRAAPLKCQNEIAVLPVTAKGLRLARAIAAFKKARIHTPDELKRGGLQKRVREAFKNKTPLVFVCACGIAVRSVAPHLKGKALDPAVVVIDEAGRFVISLVSGHLGGANALALELAGRLKAAPVITTATDAAGLPCIEDLAKRFCLVIEDVKGIKGINSAVLKGERVLVVDRDLRRLVAMRAYFRGGPFDFRRGFPRDASGYGGAAIISADEAALDGIRTKKSAIVLRPRELVAGVGCMRGVTPEEVEGALRSAFFSSGLSFLSLRGLATIDIKRDEKGLVSFAEKEGLTMEFFNAGRLNGVKPPSGASRAALRYAGVRSVSEAAAILSSGSKKLISRKTVWGRVTVAIAKIPFTS